jgi:hypothetical protein
VEFFDSERWVYFVMLLCAVAAYILPTIASRLFTMWSHSGSPALKQALSFNVKFAATLILVGIAILLLYQLVLLPLCNASFKAVGSGLEC